MGKIIKRFSKFWKRILNQPESQDYVIDIFFDDSKPVFFKNIISVTKTPSNEQVKPREFIVVEVGKTKFWTLFQCPCGCGHIISLSLQINHQPNWVVKVSKGNRPTLYPSVWQNSGCKSHFWIYDGRVIWCSTSGKDPW